jgi:hypothetical protein
MNKTETRIYERLISKPLEDIERISEFGKSKTERTLAKRLLKLFYKKLKEFESSYWLAEPCSFAECREETTIRAFSLNHALQKTLKEQVKPTLRRYCEIEDNMITYTQYFDRSEFSENYQTETFIVENTQEIKEVRE